MSEQGWCRLVAINVHRKAEAWQPVATSCWLLPTGTVLKLQTSRVLEGSTLPEVEAVRTGDNDTVYMFQLAHEVHFDDQQS